MWILGLKGLKRLLPSWKKMQNALFSGNKY